MCACWRQSCRFLALGVLDLGECDAEKQMARYCWYCHTGQPLSAHSWSASQAKHAVGVSFQQMWYFFEGLVYFCLLRMSRVSCDIQHRLFWTQRFIVLPQIYVCLWSSIWMASLWHQNWLISFLTQCYSLLLEKQKNSEINMPLKVQRVTLRSIYWQKHYGPVCMHLEGAQLTPMD